MTDMWRTISDMPVLMKAGAIVPMTNMDEYSNTVKNPNALDVLVFPAGNGHFTLWEDEGDTVVDKDENWASTELTYADGQFTIGKANGNLSVIPEARSWNVTFCSVENSDVTVTVDGKPVSVVTSYDKNYNRLTVKIPQTDVNSQVVISVEKVSVKDNRKQRSYEVLERSQMSYDMKDKIWKVMCKQSDDTDGIEMSDEVKACLDEVAEK